MDEFKSGFRERLDGVKKTLRARLKDWPEPIKRPLIRARVSWQSFKEFLAELVGVVPSHTFRLAVYRLALGVKIGRDSTIHRGCRFFKPAGVCIGHNTIVGSNVWLDGRDGLTIGNNVNISGEVAIFTREHDPDSPDFSTKGGPVVIGDYAYIATRALILPGVRIGEGAVIAAGAVVTGDVPEYVMVGGIPAKFIRERSRDLRYSLKYRWWLH